MLSAVVLFVFCGFSTLTLALMPNTNAFNGEEVTRYVDPFLQKACRDNGINFEDAQADATYCVQRVNSAFIRNLANNQMTGGGGSYNENDVVMCKMEDKIKACTKSFINEMKLCYEDDSKKQKLDMALEIEKATLDYICEDNGRRFSDVSYDKETGLCMANKTLHEEMMECVKEQIEKINHLTADELGDEEKCKLSIKLSNCALDMASKCKTSKAFDFLYGLYEAGLRASPCEPYVDDYLSSAGSISIHFGLMTLLALLYIYVL